MIWSVQKLVSIEECFSLSTVRSSGYIPVEVLVDALTVSINVNGKEVSHATQRVHREWNFMQRRAVANDKDPGKIDLAFNN